MLSSESSGVSKRKPFSKARTPSDGKSDAVHRKKKKSVLRLVYRDTANKRPDDGIATVKETRRSKSFSENPARKSVRNQRTSADVKQDEIPEQGKKKRLIRSSPRETSNKRWKDGLASSREARTSEPNVPDTKRKSFRKSKPIADENPEETSIKRKKHPPPRLPSHASPKKPLKDDAVTPPKGKSFRKPKFIADENPEETPIKRKKKKRVIRLDPYDTSNKRLDDGIVIPELPKPKPKESKPDEISKNAQFRAINPSQSILKFVENNLLGRRRPTELQKAGYNIDLSAPLDNTPFSTSEERERIEDSIFRNKLNFFAAAKVASSFPPPNLPEIAFAGRSNVGKSSLLNSLTRQWGVARTSDKPGHTQTINFFELGEKLSLVDLPGYGFAYAKDDVKDAWEELVKEYVTSRSSLKRVCLLVDTKWGMKARDYELVHLMEGFRTSYQIVLTKTDLVFPMDVARRAMQIEENLKANRSLVHPLMMVSSKSGAGIRCLRSVLSKIGRFAKV